MDQLIISVSGLRGIVGQSLTPDVAARYAAAFSLTLRTHPAGAIVLSRDGRASGPMLADAIAAALVAEGRDVIDAGVAATPTTGVLVRQLRAIGGMQISASHNPAAYNGLKLFSHEGRLLPQASGAEVMQIFERGEPAAPQIVTPGRVRKLDDATSFHWSLIEPTVDVPRIRARQFRVLLDANHGAGSLLGRRLPDELGCHAVLLGETPDGQFAHTPEPTAENLAGVLAEVTRHGCDVGFCQDPDADRLALIDENGRYIGEEYTLALCVQHRLSLARGPVVTNCSTSRMTRDLAERAGAAYFMTPVGEANVVDEMRAQNALIGGEGNGGVIDPRVGMVRDSFVGMAQILDLVASSTSPLGELADALPRYEIVKTKMELSSEKTAAALDALARHFPQARADRSDGLRLDWPDRWLLVRSSNTEPIVRAVAEARDAAAAAQLCEEAKRIMAQV